MTLNRIFLLATTLLLIFNLIFWGNVLLGIIAALGYFIALSVRTGNTLFASELQYIRSTLGLFVVTALFMFFGMLLFYVWELNTAALLITTILVPLVVLQISKRSRLEIDNSKLIQNLKFEILNLQSLCIALYLILVGFAFLILSRSQSLEALRSPWEAVSSSFLLLYFFATLVLLVFVFHNKKETNTAPLFLTSVHLFLTYSVATLVYGINFGFDPFVHQASEKLLVETGTISPKPLLYLGQYSFVVWLSKISGIAITMIDRLLVPVLAALTLPAALYYSLSTWFNLTHRSLLITAISIPLLLLPFFFSVPQNLGNLFLLLVVLLSLPPMNAARFNPLLWFLGIVTFFIHPFSGVPALIYLGLITINSFKTRFKNWLFVVFALLSTLALPATLLVGSSATGNEGSRINAPESLNLKSEILNLADWIPFYSSFHTIEFYASNYVLLIIIAALTGMWILRKTDTSTIKVLLTACAILLADVLVLKWLPIPIIAYELPEFIARFWQIAFLFLVPIVLFALANLIKTTLNSNKSVQYALVFFLCLFLTSATYILYPRTDTFAKSRAFATSQHDIAAVRWIELDAGDTEYVVLSNQAVAAAALQETGFKKYYNVCHSGLDPESHEILKQVQDDNCQILYYYPIPTTSPLYEIYLDMVYIEPTKNRLEQAMDLVGVDTGYFVINDYWLDSEKRVEQAREEIGEPIIVGEEQVYVFKYKR